jgi:hypothetical protein
MAASPRYKLFDAQGVYQASAKQPELLAACIGLLGHGATIRDGRPTPMRILWTEGENADGIGFESYDTVALKCYERQDPRFNRD